MENNNKKQVLKAVISLFENQLFTGEADNLNVWIEDLYDEEDKLMISNDTQKELIYKIANIINEVSYILAD